MRNRRLASEAEEERAWTCRSCDTLTETDGPYCRSCAFYWEDVAHGYFDWAADLSDSETAD